MVSQNKPPNRGQSIVEVIIALAVMVLVLVALVRATIVAVRNANFAKNQAQATQYSEELLEWLRSERDTDWDNFVSYAGSGSATSYCFQSLSWPSSGSCSPGQEIAGIFLRQGSLNETAADRVEIVIAVTWQDSSGTHQSTLTSYLTNWRNQ